VALYQNTVVNASAEAENGMVTFLVAQDRARLLGESVDAAYRALAVIVAQYEAGLQGVDFNRYAVILQSLVSQQDQWASSQGQIGQGLIQVYRALGGGWEIRLGDNANVFRNLPPVINIPAFTPEEIPAAEAIAEPVPTQPQPPEATPADQLPPTENMPPPVPLQPLTPPSPESAPTPLPPPPAAAVPADRIPATPGSLPPTGSVPAQGSPPVEELPSASSRRLPRPAKPRVASAGTSGKPST
jgi:hypothetical protein